MVVVRGRSLEQFGDVIYSGIKGLHYESDGARAWPYDPVRDYFSGRDIISPNGNVLVDVGNTRFLHYLQEARRKGIVGNIRNGVEPLGMSIFVRDPPEYLWTWIGDLENLRRALQGRSWTDDVRDFEIYVNLREIRGYKKVKQTADRIFSWAKEEQSPEGRCGKGFDNYLERNFWNYGQFLGKPDIF